MFLFFLGEVWVGDICLIYRLCCSGDDVNEELNVNFDKNNRVNFILIVGLIEVGFIIVFSSL